MAISANLILLPSFGGLVYTSFTKMEDMYCKSRYDAYYRDLDEAKSACDADARCFGINDKRCDGIKEDGSINTSGNWFRKCFHEKNDEKHESNINTCVYVKGNYKYTHSPHIYIYIYIYIVVK